MSRLIPQTLLSDIPNLYDTEGVLDPLCHVKLFTPDSTWTWFIIEISKEDGSKIETITHINDYYASGVYYDFFVAGKFDTARVKEIIANDTTPLPAGCPKLWFNVYSNKVFITNLTYATLHKYDLFNL